MVPEALGVSSQLGMQLRYSTVGIVEMLAANASTTAAGVCMNHC